MRVQTLEEAIQIFETIEDKLKHDKSWPVISNRWLRREMTNYFRLVSFWIICFIPVKLMHLLNKLDALIWCKMMYEMNASSSVTECINFIYRMHQLHSKQSYNLNWNRKGIARVQFLWLVYQVPANLFRVKNVRKI